MAITRLLFSTVNARRQGHRDRVVGRLLLLRAQRVRWPGGVFGDNISDVSQDKHNSVDDKYSKKNPWCPEILQAPIHHIGIVLYFFSGRSRKPEQGD